MERNANRVMMGLGLFAGLLIGTGHPGGGVALAIAAVAAAWLIRAEAWARDRT